MSEPFNRFNKILGIDVPGPPDFVAVVDVVTRMLYTTCYGIATTADEKLTPNVRLRTQKEYRDLVSIIMNHRKPDAPLDAADCKMIFRLALARCAHLVNGAQNRPELSADMPEALKAVWSSVVLPPNCMVAIGFHDETCMNHGSILNGPLHPKVFAELTCTLAMTVAESLREEDRRLGANGALVAEHNANVAKAQHIAVGGPGNGPMLPVQPKQYPEGVANVEPVRKGATFTARPYNDN